jgi:hypothetical protein
LRRELASAKAPQVPPGAAGAKAGAA